MGKEYKCMVCGKWHPGNSDILKKHIHQYYTKGGGYLSLSEWESREVKIGKPVGIISKSYKYKDLNERQVGNLVLLNDYLGEDSARAKYYCSSCKANHYLNSEIGMLHRHLKTEAPQQEPRQRRKSNIVRKNNKKMLDKIFGEGKFTIHTLDNYFKGEPVSGDVARKNYERGLHTHVSLNDDKKSGYVHIHSNHWYKFTLDMFAEDGYLGQIKKMDENKGKESKTPYQCPYCGSKTRPEILGERNLAPAYARVYCKCKDCSNRYYFQA